MLALLIAAPFLRDQFATVAARGDGASDHYRSFRRARRFVSAHAAPRARPAGLLAHSAAARVSGDLHRRRDRARRHAADIARRGWKKPPSRSSSRSPAPGSSSRGFWSARIGDNNDLGLRAVLPAAMVLIIGTAAAMMRAPRRVDRRCGAWAGSRSACPTPSRWLRYNLDRIAGRGRANFRAGAGIMGRGAPPCAADRARRQQSAVPAGPDAVAGEHVLGAARRSQLVLCRARNGACLCAFAAGSPRGDQRAIHPRLRRAWQRRRRRRHGEAIMPATSWSSCRRTAPGPTTRSPPVPIIAWRKRAAGSVARSIRKRSAA